MLRQFEDRGHYFVLTTQRDEQSLIYKTHVIIQKCKGTEDYGIQIKSFYKKIEALDYELSENPYAGIYLTLEEWNRIFKALAACQTS